MRTWSVALAVVLTALPLAAAASLEKARVLQENGLLEEAKRELVEVAVSDAIQPDERAEALLLLGDIAIEQDRPDSARDNWSRIVRDFPDSTVAPRAKEKLKLLDQLLSKLESRGTAERPARPPRESGTVLVLSSNPQFPWAALEISGTLRGPAEVFAGSLVDALGEAKSDDKISGIVDVAIDVESAFETVRAVCYHPQGGEAWQYKTMLSGYGSQEQMARRMVKRIAEKTKGQDCP